MRFGVLRRAERRWPPRGVTTRHDSRNWTEKYPRVAADAAKILCRSAVLDGEVIIQDEHGRFDLEALYPAMAEEPDRIVFFAFDLLHGDGEDLFGRETREQSQRQSLVA